MDDVARVDARGLVCPQPVIETKKMLENRQVQRFVVLVDNPSAMENVGRFAKNQGCEVQVEELAQEEFRISISRGEVKKAPAKQVEVTPCPLEEISPQRGTVVFVGNNRMGSGDEGLGRKLMRGFLRTWIDVDPKPWRMIFINSGVKLTTTDEEAVEALQLLQERGVEILSCGACLQHFALEDQLKAGKVTNMFEVIETLNSALKVLSPG